MKCFSGSAGAESCVKRIFTFLHAAHGMRSLHVLTLRIRTAGSLNTTPPFSGLGYCVLFNSHFSSLSLTIQDPQQQDWSRVLKRGKKKGSASEVKR